MSTIRVTGLRVRHRGTVALDGVDLTLGRGVLRATGRRRHGGRPARRRTGRPRPPRHPARGARRGRRRAVRPVGPVGRRRTARSAPGRAPRTASPRRVRATPPGDRACPRRASEASVSASPGSGPAAAPAAPEPGSSSPASVSSGGLSPAGRRRVRVGGSRSPPEGEAARVHRVGVGPVPSGPPRAPGQPTRGRAATAAPRPARPRYPTRPPPAPDQHGEGRGTAHGGDPAAHRRRARRGKQPALGALRWLLGPAPEAEASRSTASRTSPSTAPAVPARTAWDTRSAQDVQCSRCFSRDQVSGFGSGASACGRPRWRAIVVVRGPPAGVGFNWARAARGSARARRVARSLTVPWGVPTAAGPPRGW